ncbi:Hypothetical_protein [Hexamita inflata]|uniref:Hypothetical_protein n=1 Tax=Hexamita inflata TaxID=28002 RepID=A0AA86P968_9EUKA|nr:Hypothetical protein HINF_LOCUS20948 [Hexamita inflata]
MFEQSEEESENSSSVDESEQVESTNDTNDYDNRQLHALLENPRLKIEDIESTIIYVNKILECKDFLNPNPNHNSVGCEKRIKPTTEKIFRNMAKSYAKSHE